ncbi:hypothetical protein HMF3257_19000 [Spirosoma telluris]|uniref:Uncharacterized protein n=2 Tax=Spirosoma telluris TaxID=2183553 RepID=A0A327NK34_9BACT|nr:hypothetical protein HMF3257_19000 [Spirosoma telluris]
MLSLTNAVAGTATLTDGVNTTTLSVSAGATSVPYSLSGLISGTGHTRSPSAIRGRPPAPLIPHRPPVQ